MSKRADVRYVKRLETEFSAEGKNYRGISSDLSCNGLFIRTNYAFQPGTILEITIHLPDGSASILKGRVRRSLRTSVALLKNGMGVELFEKDTHFIDFMQIFNERENKEPCDDEMQKPPDAPSKPENKTGTADFLIIACPSCGVKNRVGIARLSHDPRCGKCGAILRAD
jgi:hypothetical protein